MRQTLHTLLLIVGLLLIAGAYWQIYELRRSFAVLAENLERAIPHHVEVGDMYHEHVSGGQRRSFTTHKNQGETVAEWVARHNAAVVAFVSQYPPDEE